MLEPVLDMDLVFEARGEELEKYQSAVDVREKIFDLIHKRAEQLQLKSFLTIVPEKAAPDLAQQAENRIAEIDAELGEP